MSGGHWESAPHLIQMGLEDIGNDEETKALTPELAKVLVNLSGALYDILNKLDYHIEADIRINDVPAFEEESLRRLLAVVMGGTGKILDAKSPGKDDGA